MAAYQALGQFIATFADPGRTGFDVNEEGLLYHCELQEFETASLSEAGLLQSETSRFYFFFLFFS